MGDVHPALPESAAIDGDGVLMLGGCRITDLVERFGTPLYVFDRASILERLSTCVTALGPNGSLHYACKAYLATWLLKLLRQAGAGIDVCSSSELAIAIAGGIEPQHIRLHGNNKSGPLLAEAIARCIGAIVVDGLAELQEVISCARGLRLRAPILLRLNPGIEAHTHRYLQTGILDSKFGIPVTTGDARLAVGNALAAPDAVELLGYHAHIGTQILELEPYELLMQTLLSFAKEVYAETGYTPSQLSPGGGVGITYTDETPPSLASWIGALREQVERAGMGGSLHLSVELGRAIIGTAGTAIYTTGTVKRVGDIRTFVSLDGGMADNIRPALYGARYAAIAGTKMHAPNTQTVTLAGPYCESGDLLVAGVDMPNLDPGDLVVLPAAGAYCLPMSSNYNGALRPAVVVVDNGSAALVQRRQTLQDLLALDV